MEKKKLNNNQIFWIEFSFWTLFACVLPVIFVAWRFDLFKESSKISLSGWGIFAILIVVIFILTLIKYIKKGLPDSYFTQCLNGFCKVVLPLLTILVILYCIKNNIEYFIQALSCTVLCELVAIFINPFPKWLKENQIEKSEGLMDTFINKLFAKKEGK